jgi:hypothetical protein
MKNYAESRENISKNDSGVGLRLGLRLYWKKYIVFLCFSLGKENRKMVEHIESDYRKYVNYVKQICDSGSLTNFKNQKVYSDILEHVSYSQGLEYLYCIFEKTPFNVGDVISFCLKNDSVGSPHTNAFDFGNGFGMVGVSPTSLRYVYQSHLILAHLQELDLEGETNIVEIGGGYGGLCVALYHFSSYYGVKINRYTIVDLSEVIRLQAMFHREVYADAGSSSGYDIQYVDASTHGKDISKDRMFCISNYCYSEISLENQHWYRYWLFPKVAHGFMCWNNIVEPSIPFKFREEREKPNTGEHNKFIYF